MLSLLAGRLPPEKPVHLLGIGDISSLNLCIPLGIDTFDSSYPTRAARHGQLLTDKGPIKADRKELAADFGPPAPGCNCWTCQRFSRAYLHHLFKARELSAYTLATIHNLHFMVQLMRNFRLRILEDEI